MIEPKLSVTRQANDLYITSGFTPSLNLSQKIVLSTGVAFTNDTVNVQGARTAAITQLDDVAAWTGGTVLAAQGDSSAPLHYNGTYIGANHGAFIVKQVTAAGHSKAVQDVGSRWTDGAAVSWYLMRIVDANTLWFVSANLSVYPAWSFASVLSGNLTHAAGATNTGATTVDSYTTTQLYPCLKKQTKTVLLDGQQTASADGTWRCTALDIVNSYDITNPAAVVAYVAAQVGGATQPDFLHTSIAADVRRRKWVVQHFGQCFSAQPYPHARVFWGNAGRGADLHGQRAVAVHPARYAHSGRHKDLEFPGARKHRRHF
jgi:hypothetical protein